MNWKVGAEKTARIAPLGVGAKGKWVVRSARMAKASKPKGFDNLKDPEQYLVAGPGGRPIKPPKARRIDWVRDAFRHLVVIGHTSATQPLFVRASIADDLDEGVIELDGRPGVGQYIELQSSSACGLARRASPKATHDRD